jgi:hypothetical protein
MRRLPLPADAEGFYQSGMDAFCPAPTPLLSNPCRPKNRANPAERQGGGKNLIGNIVLRSKFRVGLLTHLHKITWKLCSEALK